MIDGICQCSRNTLRLLYEESSYFRTVLNDKETLKTLSIKDNIDRVDSFDSLLSFLPGRAERDVDELMILHAKNGNLESFVRCVKNGGSKWKKSAYYAEYNYHNNILDWMFLFFQRNNLKELLAIYASRTFSEEEDISVISVTLPTKDILLSGMLLGAVAKQDLCRVKYLTKSKISNVSEALEVGNSLNMTEIVKHLSTID